MSRRIIIALVAALAITAPVAIAAAAKTLTAERKVLAQSQDPVCAAGRTLNLYRVTIPAGVQLPLHHHPGTQIAYIERGTLSYTVEQGSVTVRRGDPTTGAKVVRTISGGRTGLISAGQWIIEQPTDIHRAANNTKKPIVIVLSSLTEKGQPLSINEEAKALERMP
jgi:quercetin dioxygenase-like cupin family protein